MHIAAWTVTAGWPLWALTALKVALKIAGVLIGARLVIILSNRLIDRLAAKSFFRRPTFDEHRVATLAGVGKSIIRYFFDFFAGVTVLSLLGVDTSSLLLGAGVAGLAVGFGAQNLVRDILSGFFLLLEDQYSVGDYVNIAGAEGIVEDVGLRATRVRAFGGELHIIPNGIIPRVTNYSCGPLRVLFEVTIPYEADTARALGIMQGALDRAIEDSDVVVEGPKVLGVSSLGPSGVRVMVWAKAKSMEHWGLERTLKLAIKEALDREGIPISHRQLFGGPELATATDRKGEPPAKPKATPGEA